MTRPEDWLRFRTKYLNYFSYGKAFLVEGYQNGARQHLALRQLLISLIPLRSVISRWVINESSADSVTNNSSDLFHETNSHNGRPGEAPLRNPLSQSRQVSRLRRVCSSRMMLMEKYGNAISQERIVGNSGLKEPFLYITR